MEEALLHAQAQSLYGERSGEKHVIGLWLEGKHFIPLVKGT